MSRTCLLGASGVEGQDPLSSRRPCKVFRNPIERGGGQVEGLELRVQGVGLICQPTYNLEELHAGGSGFRVSGLGFRVCRHFPQGCVGLGFVVLRTEVLRFRV